MTTETNDAHNVTSLPPAPKQRKIRNPFHKDETATADASEPKKKLHGVYAAGALLLVGGVVAAAASRLGRKGDSEGTEDSSDTTDVA